MRHRVLHHSYTSWQLKWFFSWNVHACHFIVQYCCVCTIFVYIWKAFQWHINRFWWCGETKTSIQFRILFASIHISCELLMWWHLCFHSSICTESYGISESTKYLMNQMISNKQMKRVYKRTFSLFINRLIGNPLLVFIG